MSAQTELRNKVLERIYLTTDARAQREGFMVYGGGSLRHALREYYAENKLDANLFDFNVIYSFLKKRGTGFTYFGVLDAPCAKCGEPTKHINDRDLCGACLGRVLCHKCNTFCIQDFMDGRVHCSTCEFKLGTELRFWA